MRLINKCLEATSMLPSLGPADATVINLAGGPESYGVA